MPEIFVTFDRRRGEFVASWAKPADPDEPCMEIAYHDPDGRPDLTDVQTGNEIGIGA